jgi:hypothetical protein
MHSNFYVILEYMVVHSNYFGVTPCSHQKFWSGHCVHSINNQKIGVHIISTPNFSKKTESTSKFSFLHSKRWIGLNGCGDFGTLSILECTISFQTRKIHLDYHEYTLKKKIETK